MLGRETSPTPSSAGKVPQEIMAKFQGKTREVRVPAPSAAAATIAVPAPTPASETAPAPPSAYFLLLQDLVELAVGLQATAESQGRQLRDLEDYLDSLLIRVMETAPMLLAKESLAVKPSRQ